MKNDRLFAITYTLINKKTVTASALAKQFDVSVRTIYRDIDTLSANGIPIYCTQGKGGGISILEHYSIDKALLSDAEQNQVLMALQGANITGQLDLDNSITKLAGLFQKSADNWIEIDFSGWEQNESDKELFSKIRISIQNSTALSFTYYNNKGVQSRRIVEPYKLIFKGTHWYLYAYCRTRNDYRFFKLTRIENLHALNDDIFCKKNSVPASSDYDSSLTQSILLHLRIDQSMAFRVYDEFRNATIVQEGNTFSVKALIPDTPWLINYLLGFGNALEIIEPDDFREEFKSKVEEILKQYL
ncbi:putative DNA-binding transcriptional regulator YafY [Lachnotalea glycerini]|uniref:Putative DNA-binding transcriptional regulator YafY n=1 Tax=Lachnotalea glycerini TaxID=1763509 RepID=A0A255SCL1_9FIRM|nr:YafY family protein [Lachnotalea glycerini]OYP50734.1 DNA-binding transcriptional regulator [Lachnotalea glycerini]PXV86315.1 putative DNA-binding transcriptional regulator YafY [Lachnotalea glycerini]RDY30406.1 YafY family transcriptional regulator [Lachnotalea glycerini]